MSISQYANRQYDYLALNAPDDASGSRGAGSFLFSSKSNGLIVTGVRKLAQRWLLEFMTKTGTLSKLPTRGSEFMREAFSGKFRSGLNIRHEFAKASAAVKKNLLAEETIDMPDDERFASAELVNFTVIPTTTVNETSGTSIVYLNMRVKITSAAGSNYETILPVPMLPRGVL